MLEYLILFAVAMGLGAFITFEIMKIRNRREYFDEANRYQNFQYLIANIRSCSKFSEVITCTSWLTAIKDNLELHAYEIALHEISLKEKELMVGLNQTGESGWRVQ